MRLVILESPYSGANYRTVEENVAYAKRCVLDCLERDEAPIVSHLLFTQPGILNDAEPWERELGFEAGHAWYRVAEACVVYSDYGNSRGMLEGVRKAREFNVPIEVRHLNNRKELSNEAPQEARETDPRQGAAQAEGRGPEAQAQPGHLRG